MISSIRRLFISGGFLVVVSLLASYAIPFSVTRSMASSLSASAQYISPDATVSQETSTASPPVSTASCSLPAPTLTSPIGGAQIDTLIPLFRWNGTGASNYKFELSNVSDFSIIIRGIYTSDLYQDITYNLLPSTTYYWRVASACSDYSLTYSTSESFHTNAITGPFLDPPAIIAPADGAIVVPKIEAPWGIKTFLLSWEDVPGASGWQYRHYRTLSDAQNDTAPYAITHNNWIAGGWNTSNREALTTPGTYYWRLLVRDTVAWGPLSPVHWFTIASGQISGLVKAADTNTPLANANVVAYRLGGSLWQMAAAARTNATGQYTLTNLPADDYRVYFFDPSGRRSEYYSNAHRFTDAISVTVTGGTTTPNIDATLETSTPALAEVNTQNSATSNPQTGEVTVLISTHPGVSPSAITITFLPTCSNGSTPANVTLLLNSQTYPIASLNHLLIS